MPESNLNKGATIVDQIMGISKKNPVKPGNQRVDKNIYNAKIVALFIAIRKYLSHLLCKHTAMLLNNKGRAIVSSAFIV